jgi:hypothetical protein
MILCNMSSMISWPPSVVHLFHNHLKIQHFICPVRDMKTSEPGIPDTLPQVP